MLAVKWFSPLEGHFLYDSIGKTLKLQNYLKIIHVIWQEIYLAALISNSYKQYAYRPLGCLDYRRDQVSGRFINTMKI